MISSKVVLTYRRKRTPSRLEPTPGQCSNSTSESPSDNISTRLCQHDESIKKHLPENQNGDAGFCVKCFGMGGNLLHCDSCSRTYHLQCIEPSVKHVGHEQWLCSACNKQQSSRKPPQQPVSESRRQRAMGRRLISLRSRKVLLTMIPGEDTSKKEEDGSLITDVNMSSGSTCKSVFTEASSISKSEDMDTEFKTSSVCLDSSMERDCNSGWPCASMSKTVDLEDPESLSKDKSSLMCKDALMKMKHSGPLITFYRRAKKKRDVNRTDTQNKSVVEEKKLTVINNCNSESDISCSYEAPFQSCSSVGQLTALLPLREDPDVSHLAFQEQEKIISKEEVACDRCTSADVPKDRPIKFTGTTSKTIDTVVNEDKQCELLKVGSSLREESQLILNNDMKGMLKPGVVSEDQASLGHLDLCVTPPDPSCSKQPIVAKSEAFLDLPNSANQKFSKEVIQTGKSSGLLETISGTVQDTPSSNHTLICRNTGINTEEHGTNCKNYGKASTVLSIDISSQDQCQQSTLEGILNETAPVSSIPSEITTCMDFEGISLAQSGYENNLCNKMSTESFLHPHFLGLSLPTEPETAAKASKDRFTISSFSSFNNSSVCTRDMLSRSASSQNSSVQRHRLMLDSIIKRAKALKGDEGCSLDKFKGSTTAWSEEELDYLWIGVRRHGRGSWDAMLQDPRLHFSAWRVAKDLADRWDEEQSKLLSGSTLLQPMRLGNPQDSSPGINSGLWSNTRVTGNRYGSYRTGSHTPTRPQSLMDETQLSLGDVYVQRERNMPKRNTFNLPSSFTMQQTLAGNGSPDMASCVLNSDLRNSNLQNIGTNKLQKHIRGQRSRTYSNSKSTRYDTGFSILQQNPADKSTSHDGIWNRDLFNCGENRGNPNHSLFPVDPPSGSSIKGNLPHWLREVVGAPIPRPTESPLPQASSVTQSLSLLHNDPQQIVPPFSNPYELPVPPIESLPDLSKNRINITYGGPRASNIPSSIAQCTNLSLMARRFDHLSNMGSSSVMPRSEYQILKNGTVDLSPTCSYPITKQKDLIIIDTDASSEETISDDQSGRP